LWGLQTTRYQKGKRGSQKKGKSLVETAKKSELVSSEEESAASSHCVGKKRGGEDGSLLKISFKSASERECAQLKCSGEPWKKGGEGHTLKTAVVPGRSMRKISPLLKYLDGVRGYTHP